MSDFLNNLATRTLGLETGVQPRLPSLFGPPNVGAPRQLPSLTGFAEGELSMEEANGKTEEAEDSRRVGRTAPSATARSRKASETQSVFWAERLPVNEVTPEREVPTVSPIISRLIAPRTSQTEIEAKAPPRVQTQETSAPNSPSQPATEPHHPIAYNGNLAFSSSNPLISQPLQREKNVMPDLSRAGKSQSPKSPHSTETLPSVRARHQGQPIVTPTIKPAAPPAFSFDERRTEPAPQPTIQVTIGRIEVRANPAPTRTSSGSNKATGKAMGLEDYLRQRDGKGERR